MGITDELRERIDAVCRVSGWDCKRLTAIADRIDAAHEEALSKVYMDMSDSEWVRLPKDADGETIHVGDELDGYNKTIEVVELRYGRSGWVLISRDGNGYADTYAFTHHKQPTVEDVLWEFAQKMNENMGMYTGEAIDADEWRQADSKTIAEYAAKLRLAGDAE